MAVITTIQWVMLDMYVPALPLIKEEFGVSEAYLNMTLNSGLIASAVGTLIGGILSDKYGRKKIFLMGLIGSAVGVSLGIFCGDVVSLIVARAINGIGSGIVISVSTAIIKDSYEGEEFINATALLQSIAAVGPIVAPTLGALVIKLSSWRGIFVLLTVLVVISLIPMLRLTETWPEERRVVTSVGDAVSESIRYSKNSAFIIFMVLLAFTAIPMWGFVGVSSYIFINEFGTSYVVYSICYAISAAMSLLGPFIYMRLCKVIRLRRIVDISLGILLASAIIVIMTGRISFIFFVIGIIPAMIGEAMMRPLGLVVILEQSPDEAGIASSCTQFIMNMVGIVGTSVASLPWRSMTEGIGIIYMGCFIGGLVSWTIILKKRMMEAFN
ncbi:MAG: MFS transporter [Clostridiales bacterium]|nr:MFS transporter [Candidatus Crickella merdequi]